MTRTIDHVDVLRSSEKFRQWHIEPAPEDDPLGCYMMLEKHYAPDELAELWGLSMETVRAIFRDEPGVLKIGKTGSKYRRGYVTLRIPEEVAERVHKKLSS